tara:strand:- start:323 stop:487 length:165 start_codon:yes stop_codon:yes gene_type:complete
MTLIQVLTTPGGSLVIFFNLIGFGLTQHSDDVEKSVTLTFKLWKLNTHLTFSIG